MKLKSRIIIMSLIVLVSGLFGVSVNSSPDPDQKLNSAYSAMNQGKFVPAKRLINEAMSLFKENNNKIGVAHTYTALGVFHKWNPKHFRHKTIGSSFDLEKSKKYFLMAIEIFDAEGESNSSAKASFGLANSLPLENIKEVCSYYDLALKKYDPNGKKFPINPRFKDFPSMVEAFKNKFCK